MTLLDPAEEEALEQTTDAVALTAIAWGRPVSPDPYAIGLAASSRCARWIARSAFCLSYPAPDFTCW